VEKIAGGPLCQTPDFDGSNQAGRLNPEGLLPISPGTQTQMAGKAKFLLLDPPPAGAWLSFLRSTRFAQQFSSALNPPAAYRSHDWRILVVRPGFHFGPSIDGEIE